MREYVILGLGLLLSVNTVFAADMVHVSELPQIVIPYADPLAEDKSPIEQSYTVKPTIIQLAEMRPAAVIDNEKPDTDKETAEETENTPKQDYTSEKPAENITQNYEAEDVIELDLGKGDLFVPNTERRIIYSDKSKSHEKELNISIPTSAGESEEEFSSKKTLFSQEQKPDEYKLNPNVSVKNTYFKSPATEETENLVPTINNSEDLRYKTTPTQFSAGEPAHNQGNYSLFQF